MQMSEVGCNWWWIYMGIMKNPCLMGSTQRIKESLYSLLVQLKAWCGRTGITGFSSYRSLMQKIMPLNMPAVKLRDKNRLREPPPQAMIRFEIICWRGSMWSASIIYLWMHVQIWKCIRRDVQQNSKTRSRPSNRQTGRRALSEQRWSSRDAMTEGISELVLNLQQLWESNLFFIGIYKIVIL